ncbi:MAG: putative 4-hydroxybenzoate polyprenyltransferase [Syntrophobacterales bacterium]|nr:putative 4-hydroxybenzoate polyprenyltransferase [Syntrophobacterales bacterium]
MRRLWTLLDMIKIQHTVFALPFAFMGALLGARGLPSGRQAFFILLAMVGARSAAMAFNRLADHHYDAQNPRTRDRALPAGLISRRAAWLFTLASAALFIFAAGQLNRLCLMLSPVALGVVFFYSYTKRFTAYSHFFLGAALGLAPIAGWLAVTGEPALTPVVLGLAVVFWVAGFDVLYALQDEDFDRQVGLHSLPVKLGRRRAMRLALGFHLAAALGFLLTGLLAGLGPLYLTAALLAGVILLLEHHLLSPEDLSRLHHAFFTLNGLVGLVLCGATFLSLWP